MSFFNPFSRKNLPHSSPLDNGWRDYFRRVPLLYKIDDLIYLVDGGDSRQQYQLKVVDLVMGSLFLFLFYLHINVTSNSANYFISGMNWLSALFFVGYLTQRIYGSPGRDVAPIAQLCIHLCRLPYFLMRTFILLLFFIPLLILTEFLIDTEKDKSSRNKTLVSGIILPPAWTNAEDISIAKNINAEFEKMRELTKVTLCVVNFPNWDAKNWKGITAVDIKSIKIALIFWHAHKDFILSPLIFLYNRRFLDLLTKNIEGSIFHRLVKELTLYYKGISSSVAEHLIPVEVSHFHILPFLLGNGDVQTVLAALDHDEAYSNLFPSDKDLQQVSKQPCAALNPILIKKFRG